ncbi:MAG: aspartate/glutamate racemase family protein [Candidatus Aminicenantia bacterium]
MKRIGILGGMGPTATLHLFKLILKETPAKKDQEHLPIIIYNNPHVPDRTSFILGNGESPLPYLIEGVKFLDNAGCEIILMPCNTAHYFYEELKKNIRAEFLHLLKETADEAKLKSVRDIGILATTGTLKTGLWEKTFGEGFSIIYPEEKIQNNLVMEAIYGGKGIKAGYLREPKKLLIEAGNKLIKNGAKAIIAGCTEVSIVMEKNPFSVPLFEPLRIIAKKAVKLALSQ